MNLCSSAPAPKKAAGGNAKKGAKAMMELEDDDEEDDSEDEEDDSEDDDDEEDSEDDDDYEGKKGFATTSLYIGPNCAALKRLLVDSTCTSICWISSSVMCFAALRHSWFESTVLLEWAFHV